MKIVRWSRRGVLAALGLFTLPAAWTTSCARPLAESRARRSALAQPLVMLLRNRSWARALGMAYLWRCDPRPDQLELVDRVLTQDYQRRLVGAPRWRLRRVVRERIEQDYSRGRPVPVAGWLLSDTEASLCALAVKAP